MWTYAKYFWKETQETGHSGCLEEGAGPGGRKEMDLSLFTPFVFFLFLIKRRCCPFKKLSVIKRFPDPRDSTSFDHRTMGAPPPNPAPRSSADIKAPKTRGFAEGCRKRCLDRMFVGPEQTAQSRLQLRPSLPCQASCPEGCLQAPGAPGVLGQRLIKRTKKGAWALSACPRIRGAGMKPLG